ncbi:MAG TPA: histidine kinase dimerization/phospho-acceptor domain-containing protein, partial [Gemmataceae bacterium]|nr:histidine kinase dimerization/phospho-acceptor domain-containing protein [Gemmataceae bacterium]
MLCCEHVGGPRAWTADEQVFAMAVGGLVSLAQERGERRLEERLREAAKMEAVGRLAGGVAHDFNNLMTVVNGFSEVLLDGPPAADPDREMVAAIREARERATRLTQQLLAFGRQQVLEPREVDLNTVIDGLGPVVRRLVGSDVAAETVLGPDLPPVKVDPTQVEQALLILAVNARPDRPR